MESKISVITWDASFREKTHTIESFSSQETQKDYEFLWVDFYSGTEVARSSISKTNKSTFKVIALENSHSNKWHLGKCINQGYKESSGDILIIPDGDIIVENDFINYVHDLFTANPDNVYYFKRLDEPERTHNPLLSYDISYLKESCKLFNSTNYAGCFCISRKNFDLINGYEEHPVFSGPGSNGMETYIRLRNAGLPIVWIRDKFIYHPWHTNSGSSDKFHQVLKSATKDYPWLKPYSGIDQSWILHQRDLNGSYKSDYDECELILSKKPTINFSKYEAKEKSIFSRIMKK